MDKSGGKLKTFMNRATRFLNRGTNTLDPKVLGHHRRSATSSGSDSFFMMLPQAAAEKALGKEKVRGKVWKHVQEPALHADMAAGNVAKDVTGKVLPKSWAHKIWSVKERLPVKGHTLHEAERPSILAPIVHAKDIATPIVMATAINKGINHFRNKEDYEKTAHDLLHGEVMKKVAKAQQARVSLRTDGPFNMDKQTREKIASTMLHLQNENQKHEKRAQALQLLYKQAEMGIAELPQTFSEMQAKLASLENQDLAVVAKALELSGGNLKLGELGTLDSSRPQNAEEAFRAAIIGEETFGS